MWIKRIILILILFVAVNAYAEKPINEKYSYRAFPCHNVSFKDRNVEEFNNTIIIGSCFYQEWVKGDEDVEKDIFPDGMTGVTFEKCNLDNIWIDENKNTVVKTGTDRCFTKKIKVQNDNHAWIVEKRQGEWKPVEPVNKEMRLQVGISIDPKDIPKKKVNRKEYRKFMERFYEEGIIPITP